MEKTLIILLYTSQSCFKQSRFDFLLILRVKNHICLHTNLTFVATLSSFATLKQLRRTNT